MAIETSLMQVRGRPFPYEYAELGMPRFASDGGSIHAVIWSTNLGEIHQRALKAHYSWALYTGAEFPGLILLSIRDEHQSVPRIETVFLDLVDELEANPVLLYMIEQKGSLDFQVNLVDASAFPPTLADYRIIPLPRQLIVCCLKAWKRLDTTMDIRETFSDLMQTHTPSELWEQSQKF